MSTLKTIKLQHPNSANPNITFDSDGDVITPGTVVMSSPFGFRNKIINGNMSVAQRGINTVSTFTTGVVMRGPYDCWKSEQAAINNSKIQMSASTFTFNGTTKNALRMTALSACDATGTNVVRGQTQFIENYNVYNLIGKKLSLSFLINTNFSGTLSVLLSTEGGGNNQFTVRDFTVIANTPSYVQLTFPEMPTINNPVSVGSTNSLNVYIAYNAQGNAKGNENVGVWGPSSKFTTNASTDWSATAGNFVEVAEVQLEEGTMATPFEHRPYATELALCQRYFQAYYKPASFAPISSGLYTSPTEAQTTFHFPLMRSTPTLFVSTGTNYYELRDSAGATSTSTFVAGVSGPSVQNFFVVTSGKTAGQAAILRFGSGGDSTSTFFTLSAEI